MGGAGPDLDAALQQIAYVADELESLSVLVDRVPAVMLTTASTASTISVADVLAARHRRDERLVTSLSDGRFPAGEVWEMAPEALNQSPTSPTGADELPDLLRASARVRRDLVGLLSVLVENYGATTAGGTPQDLGEDLEGFAAKLYGLVHADAAVFREVAYVLYSGPVTGRKGG
jgi:hypothetical protein